MHLFFQAAKNFVSPDFLRIRFSLETIRGPFGPAISEMECLPDNFADAYEQIKNVIDLRIKYACIYQIAIDLSGKFNGQEINMHFDDFDKFKEYSAEQGWVKKPMKNIYK